MSEGPGSTAEVLVPKAAELVAARLRRQIVVGERIEGEMLPPEIVLCAQLGVSRPTLRQALRILESELLVTVLRGRNGGTRVNRPSAEVAGRYLGNLLQFERASLDDVHTARLLLEPAAVATLAGRLTPAQLDELRGLAAAVQREGDPPGRRAAGERFHTALVGMTGNPAVTLFTELVQRLIGAHAARFEQRREPSGTAAPLDAHDRVLELLRAGAAQEAARVWREHLEDVHARLRADLDTTRVLDLEL
jgi:DNA-binding FadR family transcriptional regulator